VARLSFVTLRGQGPQGATIVLVQGLRGYLVFHLLDRDQELGVLREGLHEGFDLLFDRLARKRSQEHRRLAQWLRTPVHRNIRRSLGFLITTNLSEIAVEIIVALHGKGEVETPMKLLWINLVTDALSGLGITMAAPDEDSMDRPPRDPSEPILRPSDSRRTAVDGGPISAAAPRHGKRDPVLHGASRRPRSRRTPG
jgi:hypothetical protein